MTLSASPSTNEISTGVRFKRALVYFGSFVLLGISLSVMGPTIPGLAEQTGSTLGQISVIFIGNSIGVIIGTLMGGWLLDRRKAHPVLAFAMTGVSLFFFFLPLATSRWMLVVILFLTGLGAGVIDVSSNTLIVWLFGHKAGPFMNSLHLSFGLGALLAPIMVDRIVIATGGIRWVYWVLALLALPVIVWITRVPSHQRNIERDASLPSASPRHYFSFILVTTGLFFTMVGTEIGYSSWIFSYAVANHLGPDTIARVLNSLFWGGFSLGRLISIPLAVKSQPQTMLLFDILGALASVGVLMLFPAWPPAVWIATFGLGLSLASMFPTSLNFAGRRIPISGRVTSYFLVGGSTGGMVLPWLIGQLFEPVGPHSMLVVCEITMSVALLLFLTLVWFSNRPSPDPAGTS